MKWEDDSETWEPVDATSKSCGEPSTADARHRLSIIVALFFSIWLLL